ncbi:hypothetical protein FIU82_06135 [Pseudoalteromonas sp. THAF3]|uniref:hypothetical protein n=1 Tax=Pseudoalteromonas sp. THAF3 TaxID=2587843 RepID=UPI0012681663|nr:hypothetical protein [Pseudoalteromonas sp. THAF3]QFU04595.1 hypothetical protein FIU82_06135 [Pseudoalteromonas sp. THAF3]
MADYLDKQVVDSGGLEAVTITAPKPFPGYKGKAGERVFLDPLTGNYLPAALATPELQGSNGYSYGDGIPFYTSAMSQFSILTDDGNVFFFTDGDNNGGPVAATQLNRYRHHATTQRTEWIGSTDLTWADAERYSNREINGLTRVNATTWLAIYSGYTTYHNYRVLKLEYDPVAQDFTVSQSTQDGTGSDQIRAHRTASIIDIGGGKVAVVFPPRATETAIVDIYQLDDLTRLQVEAPTPFNTWTNLCPETPNSRSFGLLAPLSDGNFLVNDDSIPRLASWNGTGFDIVGTFPGTTFFEFGPMIKLSENVFANVSVLLGDVLGWRVVEYDPVTQSLTHKVSQSVKPKTSPEQAVNGSAWSYTVIDGKILAHKDKNLMVIEFEPETYKIRPETYQEVKAPGGLSFPLTFTEEGFAHGLRSSDWTVSSGCCYFMIGGLFTIGNLIPGYAPIPVGTLKEDDTESTSKVWLTTPLIKGEALVPGKHYGNVYAVSEEYAVKKRSADSLMNRVRSMSTNDVSSIANWQVFTTDYPRVRGGYAIAFHEETLRATFGYRGANPSSDSIMDFALYAEGMPLAGGQVTRQSDHAHIVYELTDVVSAGFFGMTAKNGAPDMQISSKIEVD